MLNIEGQLVLKIVIDGKEMPIQDLSLAYLQLSENDLMGLPCGSLKFGDPLMWIKKMVSLRTGVKVLITIGKTMQNAKTYKMQVFDWKDTEEQASIVYNLVLIYDAAPYISVTHIVGKSGTSDQVLEAIAKASGLTYSGVKTKDTQLWLPMNKTGFKWAIDVASNGFIDLKSCMRVGVTLDGVMRYANVMDISQEKARAAPQFLHGAEKLPPNGFVIWSKTFGDVSGFNNITGGQKTVQQSQGITTPSSVVDKATLTRKSQFSSIPATAGRNRVDMLPVDAGNVHANYGTARYQNTRLWRLQSSCLALVCLDVTPVSLYDMIYVQVIDVHNGENTPVQNPDQSGVYTVVGKTIYVSPTGQYVEKLVVRREGNNSNVSAKDTRK